MLVAFSLLFWIFLGVTYPLFFAVGFVLFVLTVPFDRRRVVVHLWACFWGSFYVYVNPLWRVRVEGRERLPWNGPAVLVSNHLSLVDILVLFNLYRPFRWVSKSSVFQVPFMGWHMRLCGYVPITRGAADSVRRMMARCRELLAQGCPVLLFPEGTRSATGELQPFKDGAFRLALDARVPVIPIALSGTHETLPKHGLVLRRRMDARVRVLEPIDPSGFGSPAELREAARAAIARALEET